jgi:hypothetical protein
MQINASDVFRLPNIPTPKAKRPASCPAGRGYQMKPRGPISTTGGGA